jgi:hypothetical protein
VSEGGPQSVRLLHFQAPDVRDLVIGAPQGRKVAHDLASATGLGERLVVLAAAPGGWAANLAAVREAGDRTGPLDVVLASVSGEVAAPSPEPAEALLALARHVHDRGGRLLVLNASVLTRGAAPESMDGDPTALRIRRRNLEVLLGSKATGLCIVDADRLVAEISDPAKLAGTFDYASSVCETLQAEVVRILLELGIAAERSVTELRVPFVRRATDLVVERWAKSEGDRVEPGDVVCELRLLGVQSIHRPTNALVLASITGREPLVRRIFGRERVRHRAVDATVSIVSADSGVLRRIVGSSGTTVREDDTLAVLTPRSDSPMDAGGELARFRAAVRVNEGEGPS